jgi:hypothetical protein
MSNFGFLQDSVGNDSSKRLIALIGATLGYLLAIIVVIYALNHVISSPAVVADILIAIVGAPFIALVATVFEKRGNPNE